jgi:DHA1 family bicyclomycin/chloramphenicol resistance-like MFS transporter
MPVWELVCMVAALMGLNAFSIDIILPALPNIGAAYDLASENSAQLVITAYVFGFGLATLIYGPLSDAFGRRGVLLGSMAGMLVCTALCTIAPSFWLLLLARMLQGAAAASTRVVAVAVVRDLVHGRRMAEIMSIAMTVFMISPIIAPGVGQLLLFVLPWRMVFGVLFAAIALSALWVWLRLPETLRPEDRTPLNLRNAIASYINVSRNRVSLGYTVASGFAFGTMFAFVATSEQVFAQQYALGPAFPLAFGGIALGMAIASFANARMVGRLGMRKISHGALVVYAGLSTAMTAAALAGFDSFWAFYIPYTVALFCFGLIGANFNSMIMEPAGRHAGVMAAASGAYTFIGGAVFGTLIGMAYDGTVLPIVAGNAILGALALATVLWVERGRLFVSRPDEG